MGLLTLSIALVLAISCGNVLMSVPNCCIEKELTDANGLSGNYILKAKRNIQNINLLPTDCRDGCIYAREGYPGKIFCFKALPPNSPTYSECKVPGRIGTTPPIRNLVTAPPLESGQSRIIMSWPNKPNDLDIHVFGFRAGMSPCRVYYSDKCGCPDVCQDIDNTNGGSSGPETVTLQDSVNNAGYTYAIGVHDYGNEEDVFGFSKAKIEVNNGTTSFSETLPMGSLPDSSWWFFGCISITPDNIITYYPTPAGTIFSGAELSEWIEMVNKFCNFTVMDELMVAANRKIILPPK